MAYCSGKTVKLLIALKVLIIVFIAGKHWLNGSDGQGSPPDWLNELSKQHQDGLHVYYTTKAGLDSKKKCSLLGGRRILANYDSSFVRQKRSCQRSIAVSGVDACLVFSKNFFDERFRLQQNEASLDHHNANVFGKPYVILRLLTAMKDDEILLYSDVDWYLVNNIEHLICSQAELKQDVVIFYDRTNATSSEIGIALLFRKSFDSIRFVSEWLVSVQEVTNIKRDGAVSEDTVLAFLMRRWNMTLWPSPDELVQH